MRPRCAGSPRERCWGRRSDRRPAPGRWRFAAACAACWLIWAFLVFPRGQTPAKQLLHLRVIYIPEARAARWWRMFFREFIAKGIIGLLAAVTLLIPYFWLLWDRNRQELWDKMATTLVVTDPTDRLRPSPEPPAELPGGGS
ncbi:RDD family protein [Streptomyces sp. P9-2B-2]|uniref:RDD family protein n=1 Tax=Streptomyces sp. P9-2B-2 TaxID=3057114 RepID=UPI0025B60ACA|nr:RDD family protein [Streptomyces sp. P9-2B-2]WJY40856.1 RDD family protein [Streptomyces sp. P9-2B-2]